MKQSPTILFYVSGHGYGHAVRIGEVIRELQRLQPQWRVLVRTRAPRNMLPDHIEFSQDDFEAGVVERDSGIVIDEEATRDLVRALIDRWPLIVDCETTFVRENRVDLIVADIPPTAGAIADKAGVPCVAITNFTWDWIYEPYAADLLGPMEDSYAQVVTLLRLPFAQQERLGRFKRVIDVPLVARKSRLGPRGLDPKLVLLGSRAQVSSEAIARAAAGAAEFEIVTPRETLSFTDNLAMSDILIAKLGFSTLAECIAARKPLLYPPRKGFREESLLQADIRKHIPALPIPAHDYFNGNWAPYLRELASMPPVSSEMRTDGAGVCAEYLIQFAS